MVLFQFCSHDCPVDPGISLKVVSSFSDTREEPLSERMFHHMLKLELSNLSDFEVNLVPEFFQCGKAESPHFGLDAVEQEEVRRG